jgi:hypothetical protein
MDTSFLLSDLESNLMKKARIYRKNVEYIREQGPKIGITEEIVNGQTKYRLKEKPNALGVWISYDTALGMCIDHRL